MDYKEKYEKAYKLLEQIHDGEVVSKTDIENTFPELKTKSVIDMLKIAIANTVWLDCDKNKCLSWLEKQGEKQDYNPYKTTIESIAAMVEKYANGDLRDFYDNVKVKCKDAVEYNKTWIEKIKPKFKVGDWIVSPGGCYLYILDIEKDGYLCKDILGEETKVLCKHPNCDFKLWTIEDAKDGVVLASKNGCPFIYKKSDDAEARYYCCVDCDNNFRVGDSTSYCGFKDSSKPATKEQRDLLFQEMKKAGYEWDADEKALVMIGIDNDEEDERYEELMEDNETSIKQNPAWSDEDEKIMKQIDSLLYCQCTIHSSMYEKLHNWLKSLKPQPHWKPTEEQLMALRDAIDNNEMESLYNDLKKL